MKLSNYIRAFTLKLIPVCLPFCLPAQGLHIMPGLQLVVNGSPSLVFNNASLVNDGSFAAGSGTVLFTGDAGISAGAFIGGSNPVCFYNLTVGKSSNDITLNNNTVVTGRIRMNGGNLQLNNYMLDLGNSSSINGETNSSCIIGASGGVIKITALLNAPQAVNPGNIGVEITSDGNLGLTTITRGHVQQSGSQGESSIRRYFDFLPGTNADIHATLRFFYLDDELAGNAKDKLSVFSSMGDAGDWILQGDDNSDADANWVIKSNVDQLNRFTLAIPAKDQPVKPVTTASLQIYPNPSHSWLTVVWYSDTESRDIISLYDQSGRLLECREVNCQQGLNTIQWDMGRYTAGIYFLGAASKGFGSVKIVKQ